MPRVIGYIRVSTNDQNLSRQMDEMIILGIEEKNIYTDKESGKDFNRVGYQYMKRVLEPKDTLVIKSLDRLGRNQKDVRKEWEWFNKNKINIRVLDMPILNREYKDDNEIDQSINELIRGFVFEIISWMDEEARRRIKTSQKEGIEAAKRAGKHLGRPKIDLINMTSEQLETINALYSSWKSSKISGVVFANKLHLKKNTFYKIIKQYENSLK